MLRLFALMYGFNTLCLSISKCLGFNLNCGEDSQANKAECTEH